MQALRGWASVHELDGNGNAYDRHMECVERGRRREDVAPVIGAFTKPACIAGVRVSRPNFNALCGRMKLS